MNNYFGVEPKTTSTERLLALAELFERNPHVWLQDQWTTTGDTPKLACEKHSCGTKGCIAGWAVSLMPTGKITAAHDWYTAGAKALGIDKSLAHVIFAETYSPKGGPVKLLRYLATLPEGERTLKNVVRALFDELGGGITEMKDVNLSNADLSDLDLSGVRFARSSLWRANLNNANLTDASLSFADLTGASFVGATLHNVHMYGARMNRDRIEREALVFIVRG